MSNFSKTAVALAVTAATAAGIAYAQSGTYGTTPPPATPQAQTAGTPESQLPGQASTLPNQSSPQTGADSQATRTDQTGATPSSSSTTTMPSDSSTMPERADRG